MKDIEFIPTENKSKHKTNGAKEWFFVLKEKWEIKQTILRENDEAIIITHCRGGKHMIIVAMYDKMNGKGWVMENFNHD